MECARQDQVRDVLLILQGISLGQRSSVRMPQQRNLAEMQRNPHRLHIRIAFEAVAASELRRVAIPAVIEEAIYLHSGVQEAAVIGEADSEWGQAVVAYVAFRDGTTESELSDFLKPRLGFKRPKRIYRVRELPKNSNGKIQKTVLKPELALVPEGSLT